MSWNRSVRLPATISLTLALALGALVAPAIVSAKPAPLEFGVGPGFNTSTATGAIPLTISPGSTVAFELWARNKGGSNISKLFLTARTDAAFGGFVLSDTGTKGSCSGGPGGGVQLRCSWKPFKPGASTRIFLFLTAPMTGDSVPVDIEWSSTGFVAGHNNSHGDLFFKMDSAAVNDDVDNFAASYVKPGSTGTDLDVMTNQTLGEGNAQSTKVHAPKTGIPVTVTEDNDISDCTEFFGEENSCFGQAIVLNLNNGEIFDNAFTVVLVYQGQFPDAQFIHFFDGGGNEEIPPCGEESGVPCFDLVVDEESNTTTATIHLLTNGKTFGH